MKNKQILKGIAIIIFIEVLYFLLLSNNNQNKNISIQDSNDLQIEAMEQVQNKEILDEEKEILIDIILNETGNTIEKRYNPPDGFERITVEQDSFDYYLRNQKLKPYGDKALYYNGKEKDSKGVYDSVIDVEIGERDLHQCADAIMLLRAEYLYQQKKYEQISFNFTNGFSADYQKWLEGYRIKVTGNDVTWIKEASYDDSYLSFRKYMDLVFSYAGSLSLEKQLIPINSNDMRIGDVFIQGGSPGHGIIVVDMAENKKNGEKVFMLAQSYMPAQQTQILINPLDKEISPWYRLNSEERLLTPQWEFEMTDLRRFQ